jgi:hypothetical protein
MASVIVAALSGCWGPRDPLRPNAAEAEPSWARLAKPACIENGCIRRARHVGDYDARELRSYLDRGVHIDNGYSVGIIEYVTHGRLSTATVTIPYRARVPADGYAIVSHAHGTVGLDDACRLSGTVYGTGLAGLFGARGAIGITPDGPGLGTPGSWPYLVREVEGETVLDSLRAARTLAQALKLPISQRYAVAGLSEGGYATLAAASLHASYAPELPIAAFAAAAPANVWFEHWQEGIVYDGPHVSYHAMLLYAWEKYYHYTGPHIWLPRVRADIDDVMREDCAFDFGGHRTTYAEDLGVHAAQIFAPAFLSAYRAGELPPALMRAFDTNAIKPFPQTAPLAIWQGSADAIVPVGETTQLVANLRTGGVQVDYHIVRGGGHLTTAFGMLSQHQLATDASLRWVRERLAAPPPSPPHVKAHD